MMLIWLVLLPLVSLLFKHFLFGASEKLPPGPYLWQVLVNLGAYIKRPHVQFFKLSKTHGPLMSFWVGSQLFVVASSPDTAKAILKNRNFSGRYLPSIYYNIPGVMHGSLVISRECNDTWKMLRGIGQSYIFSTRAVESNAPIRKKQIAEMVNYLRTKEGQVVNIDNVTFSTLTNIVTNVLISRNLFKVDRETGTIDQKVLDFVIEVTENATTLGLVDLYPTLKRIDCWSKRKAMDMYENILLIWGDIIKERRASGTNTNSTRDYFDILVENNFSNEQIALLLMELQIASSDTTTVITVWLLIELMKNPHMLSRVRDEIESKAVEGNNLNQSCLIECEYLNACVKETLRLHTPGPFGIPHRAIETDKVNNYVIPKDSVVLVNFWAIHQDPKNWEDAASFKPERFLDSKVDFRGTHFEFLPFSAGQRMCPGSNVATKGVQTMVATLVHYFDWSLPDGVDSSTLGTNIVFGTTLKMDKPLCLIPRMRGK